MAQPPERYDAVGIMEAMGFLQLIKDRFPANSVTREEFFALLTDFYNGRTTDCRAVVARATELLQGHLDLVDRFQAFLDPDAAANRFLERVKRTGMRIFDEFIANLLRLREEPELDAHAIYARFRQVFGPDNEDLFRGSVQFLPTVFDMRPCAEAEGADRRQKLKRQHVADSGVGVAKHNSRSRAKQRDPDDGHTPNLISSAGSRPSRAKKPRANNGENRCSAPLSGGAENVTGRVAATQDDGKKEEVSRFRTAWAFETGYSKLVTTMARAEELQRERAEKLMRRQRARGASLEELFPSRECREFLADMYGEAWRTMRKMLENDEYTGSALEVILKRSRVMEAAAAEAARSWQDPTRAGQRLNDLVQDRVREERERRGA